MSSFDAEEFLNNAQSAAFDTRIPLCKAGDWDGYIGADPKDITIRAVNVTNKETGAVEARQIMGVQLYTENPAALSDGAVAPARCRLDIWLDIAADGKSLDLGKGKNRQLGYLLTATKFQDKAGVALKPWSKTALAGQRLKFTVEHKPRKDNGELQAEVSKVAAAA